MTTNLSVTLTDKQGILGVCSTEKMCFLLFFHPFRYINTNNFVLQVIKELFYGSMFVWQKFVKNCRDKS